jgi:hypothetical protein
LEKSKSKVDNSRQHLNTRNTAMRRDEGKWHLLSINCTHIITKHITCLKLLLLSSPHNSPQCIHDHAHFTDEQTKLREVISFAKITQLVNDRAISPRLSGYLVFLETGLPRTQTSWFSLLTAGIICHHYAWLQPQAIYSIPDQNRVPSLHYYLGMVPPECHWSALPITNSEHSLSPCKMLINFPLPKT